MQSFYDTRVFMDMYFYDIVQGIYSVQVIGSFTNQSKETDQQYW